MTSHVELRAVTDAELAFVRDVYASTRQAELDLTPWSEAERAAFVDMQFTAQLTDYRRRYPQARHDLIVVDGEPAGRFYVDRSPRRIHVLDIALLPAWRGRGIATALLGALVDEARRDRKALDLSVERWNPAASLYRRLGLEVVEEGPIYLRMEIDFAPASG